MYYRSSAVPGTWEYLELLEQEDQEEAKISKRFKMMRRKKEVCDCHFCIEKAQNVKHFKESIDESLILLLNRCDDVTTNTPKGLRLFGSTKMIRSASLRNVNISQFRPRILSSPNVNVSREVKQRLWCKSVKDRIKESEDTWKTSPSSVESPSATKRSKRKSIRMSLSEHATGIHNLKNKLESLVI